MKFPISVVLSSLTTDHVSALINSDRQCKWCNGKAKHFDYCDFNKSCNGYPLGRSNILVEYFRCQSCQFIFTDFFDDWNHEDFATYVYNDEYINVDPDYVGLRAKNKVDEFHPVLQYGKKTHSLLDYGGGAGTFTKGLRDRGFKNVQVYDPFSQPEKPDELFDVVTAFEVVEHSISPRETFTDMLSYMKNDGCLIVSQTIQPKDIDTIGSNWWYMAPRNGHVSFYSDETLRILALDMGLQYFRNLSHFVLHRASTSAYVDHIKHKMGMRQNIITMYSPEAVENIYSAWHNQESGPFGAFRWSAEEWIPFGEHHFDAGESVVEIPFIQAINDDFLENIFIQVATTEARAEIINGKICATFSFHTAARRFVFVRTSVLISPAELGVNEDGRKLGIAVPTKI